LFNVRKNIHVGTTAHSRIQFLTNIKGFLPLPLSITKSKRKISTYCYILSQTTLFTNYCWQYSSYWMQN